MSNQVYIQPAAPAPEKHRSTGGCLGAAILLVLFIGAVYFLMRGSRGNERMVPVFTSSVGVVRIEGPISESKDIVKILRSFRRSTMIKSIVLRLDTPGGSVGASEEIYREVMRARTEDKKHVVASMGNAAASGGYYIAMGAEEIFANSGTITGSIGVIAPDFNIEETMRKLGVKSITLKSGEHKDSGSPFREMSPEERHMIQGVIYDMYRQFFTVVLRARHDRIESILHQYPEQIGRVLDTAGTKTTSGSLEWDAFTTGTAAADAKATTESETALRRMADGRIFTGDQALKLGLIDRIGTLQDAIERAGKMAGLDKDPHVVDREPESDLPSWLGASAGRFWQELSRSSKAARIEMRDDR
ncbi:MAG: signal peptide peptidase SppA [Candidatus Sumerlaeaceae bacterium]